MTATAPVYRLTERADVLGYLPYALGFHPADSIVVVGLRERRVVVCARADLAWPLRETLRLFVDVLRRQADVGGLIVVGYGAAGEVDGTMAQLRAGLEARGYPVMEALRVTGGSYHCLLCSDCTPPGGAPFDIASSAGAALGTYQGLVVEPDRETVQRKVRPVGGLARFAVSQATDRAEARLVSLVEAAAEPEKALRRDGEKAVEEALARARDGGRLTDDDVAWLSILLQDLHVRDHAWLRTDAEEWQLGFWLDLTRRSEPALVAPIASMLAWCAWRGGNGVLAGAALERALRVDPHYSLAQTLMDALSQGLPPSAVGTWPAKRRKRRPRR